MPVFNFQKPDKVIMIDSSEFEGKFEFRPLEPGYGLTVGNALRRVLLSSLEGFAFTSVKIENIDHEFSSLPGIVEDVTEIILNLKQVCLKRQIDTVENESVPEPSVVNTCPLLPSVTLSWSIPIWLSSMCFVRIEFWAIIVLSIAFVAIVKAPALERVASPLIDTLSQLFDPS